MTRWVLPPKAGAPRRLCRVRSSDSPRKGRSQTTLGARTRGHTPSGAPVRSVFPARDGRQAAPISRSAVSNLRSSRRAAEHRTDDGVIAGAFGTGHRSPPAGRGAKHRSSALTDHFRKTLDEPIPALGNQTPRKAVKTAKGRKKVIAWLKMLENKSAQQRPEDPMGAYDFTWLRELGVGDERR